MHSKRLVGCLLVALLTTEIHAGIRASVSSSLSKISTRLSSIGRNVQTKVNKITDFINSDEGGEFTDTVSSSIETMGGAVDGMTSSDVLSIVGGTMDMISAITALIPGKGQLVSVVFGLVGSIIGAIGGGDDDVGSIVKREIEKALNNYDDSELRAEAEGTMRVYRLSQAYLNSVEGDEPMNEHEVATLAANVPIYSGVKFLGILATKIKQNTESSDATQVRRAAEYLQLYVSLAVVRTAILWEMYSVVREAPNSDWTASAIKRVVEAEQDHDKDFLQFLTSPIYTRAIFFAYFNPSEWPATIKFMSEMSLSYQRLDFLASGKHYLRPEKWTNWYMLMGGDAWGIMKGTTSLNDQSKFYFDTISAENNVYYMRNAKWPSWYVIMNNDAEGNCRGWGSAPGNNGKWKVIKFSDGKYLISPIQWPNWFIYMKNDAWGHIRGWNGDPGVQGHWLID